MFSCLPTYPFLFDSLPRPANRVAGLVGYKVTNKWGKNKGKRSFFCCHFQFDTNGGNLFLVPLFLCLKEIIASPWNDKRRNGWTKTKYQLDENDVSARREGCISAKKRMVMRDWSRSLPGLEQVFVGMKAMGSRNFTIAKISFHYSKKIFWP